MPKDLAAPQTTDEEFEQWVESEEAQDMLVDESYDDPTVDESYEDPAVDESYDDPALYEIFDFDQPTDSTQIPPAITPSLPPLQTPQYFTPPSFVPNVSMGPAFHPMIGWYFPAVAVNTAPNPFEPISAFPQAPTPMQPGYASASPSRPVGPAPFQQPPKPSGRRRPEFPADLEARAKANLQDMIGTSGAATCPKVSSKARKTRRGKKVEEQHPLRSRKMPPTVQTCICNDKESRKIKRPKNAFILFRSAYSQGIVDDLGSNNNQAVSRVAAEAWRNAPVEVKRKYYDLQEKEKARHEALYPEYKYKPGMSKSIKFGSASCKCGAYAANIAALRADAEPLEDDAGDVSLSIPAMDPVSFTNPPGVVPTPHTNSKKRKRTAEAITIPSSSSSPLFVQDDEAPPSKRRSARLNTSDSFTGPMFTPVMSSSPQQQSAQISPRTTSPAVVDDCPAYNTRSNTQKPRSPSPPSTAYDFGSPVRVQDLEWSNYFDDAELLEDLFGIKDFDRDEMRPSSRDSNGSATATSPTMVTRSRSKVLEEEEERELRRSPRNSTKEA